MARATRRLVLKRDGHRCTECGQTWDLHVHHIVPRSAGGTNELSNLVTLCFGCHERLHAATASLDENRGDQESTTCAAGSSGN